MRKKFSNLLTGTHLDYGINDGHVTKRYFSHIAKDLLFVADIKFQVAKENLNIAKNFLLVDQSTSKIEIQDGSFDSISCMHVLEHVPKPENVISEFSRLLKRNGILYIETPNSMSLLVPSFSKGRTWNFYDDPTHIRPYNSNTLSSLVADHGFVVVKSGVYRHPLYLLAFPFSIFISLILRDWRPFHYSLNSIVGWSSYVYCKKT